MRYASIALAVITAGSIAALAQAQTGPAMKEDTGSTLNTQGAPGVRVGTPANPTLAPAQRARIKQYVTERRLRPITVRERLAVGATLPTEVELLAVPTEWGPELSPYRYVYAGDDVVLVEPSSRRVIQIID
jgi:Protein of unknown function (DUF1236)